MRKDREGSHRRRFGSAFARKGALFAVLVALSCGGPSDDDKAGPSPPRLGYVQSGVDSDSDGLDDAFETTYFGGLSHGPTGDFDSDGMSNLEEFTHGFNPTVNDAFEDADFDRYPNIFELRRGSNPTSAASIPTANYTVNGAGGGTHTTIGAAVTAADVANGAYQIVAIAPGVYKGPDNLGGVRLTSDKPKMLFIGLEGAAKTIIDGDLNRWGWLYVQSAVVASLTFRRVYVAASIQVSGGEVRFVDVIMRDNAAPSYPSAIWVSAAKKVHVAGSTFIDNSGPSWAEQIYFGDGAGAIVNTVVTSKSTGTTLVARDPSWATLTTSYSFVKGQTLTGTGNLAGSVDPKLRSDARLRSDSPLRAAGLAGAYSRVDMDGESRPSSGPDIGADAYYDSDSDSLPDWYELAKVGNLTSLTGSADPDSDGLTNLGEYDYETDYLDPDTDNDLLKDGQEVALGKNPLVADADDLGADVNHDGVIDSIGVQLGHQPNATDSDGDGVSNADELLMCTNPVRADTDGDGTPDATDKFPLDPLLSAFPSNPSDVTPPVITLTAPWYAVEQ